MSLLLQGNAVVLALFCSSCDTPREPQLLSVQSFFYTGDVTCWYVREHRR